MYLIDIIWVVCNYSHIVFLETSISVTCCTTVKLRVNIFSMFVILQDQKIGVGMSARLTNYRMVPWGIQTLLAKMLRKMTMKLSEMLHILKWINTQIIEYTSSEARQGSLRNYEPCYPPGTCIFMKIGVLIERQGDIKLQCLI